MKKQLILLLIALLCISQKELKAQTNEDILKSRKDKVEKDSLLLLKTFDSYINEIKARRASVINELSEKNGDAKRITLFKNDLDGFLEILSDKEKEVYLERISHKGGFNSKMINNFISKEISSFFNGASDFSLRRLSTNYNTENKVISADYNVDLRQSNKNNDELSFVLSVGADIKTSDEFGAIFENGDFQEDNLTARIKLTKIFPNSLNFNPIVKSKKVNGELKKDTIFNGLEIAEKFRADELSKKYKSQIKAYLAKNFGAKRDSMDIIYDLKLNKKGDRDSSYIRDFTKLTKNKYDAWFKAIADEEINFTKQNGIYRSLDVHWFSLDASYAMGNQKILTASSESSSDFQEDLFKAYSFNFSWTYLRKYNRKYSFYLSPIFSIRNNNNIQANSLSSKTFQEFVLQSDNEVSLTDSNNVFIAEYEEEVTPSIKIDGAILFANFAGFSASIEKNFGTFDNVNWKMGIPITFKDKKGKPTINIELQWRELNNQHAIGLATSLLFGKLIN